MPAAGVNEVLDAADRARAAQGYPVGVQIDCIGKLEQITFVERGDSVTLDCAFNRDNSLWDYGDGDAGNSPTPPPTFERDVWSATFVAASGQFTAFTLAADG